MTNTVSLNSVLLNNLKQIANPDFGQRKKGTANKKSIATIASIRNEWKDIIDSNQQTIENLYHTGQIDDWVECRTLKENDFSFEDDIYTLLINLLATTNYSQASEVNKLHLYVKIVVDNDYNLNPLVLLKYHSKLLPLIKQLIKIDNFKIGHETFADLIENLINIYFYHSRSSFEKNYQNQFDKNKVDVALLIPDFIRAFPDNCNNLTFSILDDAHPNVVDEYAKLLHFYITNSALDNTYCPLSSNLLGRYNSPSDIAYKNAYHIIKKAISFSELSDAEINYLIEQIVLSPLSISTKESQFKELELHIKNLHEKGFEQSIIKKYQQQLINFDRDFDRQHLKNTRAAVRRIAVSAPTRKCFELIIKSFPGTNKVSLLSEILLQVTELKNKKPTFNINNKPQTIFKDFHFKLLVIEELMYRQNVLKPQFDLQQFAKEYTKREIDIEEEGYEIIPEVKKFFNNLDITQDQLHMVTQLYQDSGFGGGSQFIYKMFPFWDPGAGDEVFKVKNKAIDDLDLLPNLKQITGLENSSPSKKLLQALAQKDILLFSEDD